MGTARRCARVRQGAAQASDRASDQTRAQDQARVRSLPPTAGDQRRAHEYDRPPPTVRGAARGRVPRMAPGPRTPMTGHTPPAAPRPRLHRAPAESRGRTTEAHRREAGRICTPVVDRILLRRATPLHRPGKAKTDPRCEASAARRRRTTAFRSPGGPRRLVAPPCFLKDLEAPPRFPKGQAIPTARPRGLAQARHLPRQAGRLGAPIRRLAAWACRLVGLVRKLVPRVGRLVVPVRRLAPQAGRPVEEVRCLVAWAGRLMVGRGRQTLGLGGRWKAMEAGRPSTVPRGGRPRTTSTARRLDPATAARPFCPIVAVGLAMTARRPRRNPHLPVPACLVFQARPMVRVRRVPMPSAPPATRTVTAVGGGGCCSPSWARPPSQGRRSGSPTSSAPAPTLPPTRVLNPRLTPAPIRHMAQATEPSYPAARPPAACCRVARRSVVRCRVVRWKPPNAGDDPGGRLLLGMRVWTGPGRVRV